MQLPDFPSREMSVQELISVLLGVAVVVVAAAVADVVAAAAEAEAVVTAKKLCLCYLFKCQQLEFHEIIN